MLLCCLRSFESDGANDNPGDSADDHHKHNAKFKNSDVHVNIDNSSCSCSIIDDDDSTANDGDADMDAVAATVIRINCSSPNIASESRVLFLFRLPYRHRCNISRIHITH